MTFKPKYNFVEELRWRGLLQDAIPGVEEHLMKELTAGYIGFDPTAKSLTIGNLVTVILLMHFQRAGHKPIALVGGATGMIGDPSGKSQERNLLSIDMLMENQAMIKAQLERFLEFTDSENSAEMVNNYDWLGNMGFLEFLRDVGKHLTVNYMMAKDSVKSRMETGISFTEFSYQLLQGYDFYWLKSNKNCMIQMGGSDQWGNITAGTELIRKFNAGEAYGITCPLLTKADGSKFGKSAEGNVWLDREMTSPYKFYQFWLNTTDEDAERFIKIFTFRSKEEIESLIEEHRQDPGKRLLQKALSRDVTIMVHSEEDYLQAVEASSLLFGAFPTEQLRRMDEALLLSVLEGVPRCPLMESSINEGINVVDLLAEATGIFPSKGEARKMISGGGVSINKEKVSSPDTFINRDYLLNGKYILAQKGKKNYYLIIIE